MSYIIISVKSGSNYTDEDRFNYLGFICTWGLSINEPQLTEPVTAFAQSRQSDQTPIIVRLSCHQCQGSFDKKAKLLIGLLHNTQGYMSTGTMHTWLRRV